MSFDLATAQPISEEPAVQSTGFDLSTATPVDSAVAATPADSVTTVDKHEDRRHETSGGKNPSMWDRIKGAGEAALNTVSGFAASAVAPALAIPTQIVGDLTDEKWSREQEQRAKADSYPGQDKVDPLQVTTSDIAKSMTYQPRTEEGQRQAGAVQEAAAPVMNELGKLPFGSAELGAVAAHTKPVAAQVVKAVEPETAALGKVAGAVKEKAANLVPSLPNIPPEAATLAKTAEDKFGIKIPLHMLYNNDFVKMTGDFVNRLPLGKGTVADNEGAFNTFLMKQIRSDDVGKTTKLTPSVYKRAYDKNGKSIGNIFSKIAVPENDPELINDLTAINKAQSRQLPEVEKVIGGYTKELSDLADKNGGVIPGPLFKKLHSEIAALLRGKETAQGMHAQLESFKNILEDAADRQIKDPADKEEYQAARVAFAVGSLLEPLVAKSKTGGVSPTELMGRLTATSEGKHRMATQAAGDLGTAAAIAENFMKDESHSYALGRHATLFGLGAAAGLHGATGGATALGGLALANMYNRFGPMIAKRIIERSLPKDESSPAAKPALQLAEPGNLTEESAFPTKAPKTRGLLSSEKPEEAQQRIGTVSGRDDKGNLIDFPLRQEVLQKPEFQTVINAYRSEAADLEKVVKNAINPNVRKKARVDLDSLQKDFAAGMKEFGVESAQDAHGLRRPLYESGVETQLPIKKTFAPEDIPK